jgi:hypothetical protein
MRKFYSWANVEVEVKVKLKVEVEVEDEVTQKFLKPELQLVHTMLAF